MLRGQQPAIERAFSCQPFNRWTFKTLVPRCADLIAHAPMTKQRSSAAGSKPKAATPKKQKASPVKAKTSKVVKPLTTKAARFVTEYLKDFSGRHAAIRAGYSAKTADQAASRMLRTPGVKAALNKQKVENKVQEHAEAISTMELTVERTKLEIARLAYFDPRRLFDAKGEPVALHDLDDDTAAAIAGLDVLEEFEGSGADKVFVGHVKKYKIADKNAALEKASKILGLYEKDNEQKKPELSEAIAAFVGGLHGAGVGRLPLAPQKGRAA